MTENKITPEIKVLKILIYEKIKIICLPDVYEPDTDNIPFGFVSTGEQEKTATKNRGARTATRQRKVAKVTRSNGTGRK